MPEIVIGNHRIADDSDVFVIAEIGHNHGGSLETALEMCRAAKECGCHAAKLQKRTLDRCYTRAFLDTPYNSEHAFGRTYGEHRAALEFGKTEYDELRRYCRTIGLEFFATAFDEEAADFLEGVGVPAYKVASGDLTNTPLIRHIAAKGKPVILSTGGACDADIARASAAVGMVDAAFLQCTAMYPTPAEKMNLIVISRMLMQLGRVVGLSSHFNGPQAAKDAYYYGARIVEQHFTLSRASKGSDHAMSLEPKGMAQLVKELRRARDMVGTPTKTRLPEEEAALAKMEKAVYPVRTLPAGHVLGVGDLTAKSPTTPSAMRPWEIDRILGRPLTAEVSTASPLTPEIVGEDGETIRLDG